MLLFTCLAIAGALPLTLEDASQSTLQHHPALAQFRAEAQVSLARVPLSGALGDLQFQAQIWGGPLARPWALNDAQALMFGVRQTLPAWGSRDAKRAAANEEALAEEEKSRLATADALLTVHRAFFELYLAEKEEQLYAAHAEVARRSAEAMGTWLSSGKATQRDVLRAQFEASRHHGELALLHQKTDAARIALNLAMGREAKTPIDSVTASAVSALPEKLVTDDSPELAAQAHALRAAESNVDAARIEGTVPELMLGLDYMAMPTLPMPHGYSLMVGLNLPWLNSKHADEKRSAELAVAAKAREREALQLTLNARLEEAVLRHRAELTSLENFDAKLIPSAKQMFAATESGFATGQGSLLELLETSRLLLEVQLDRERCFVRTHGAEADARRAAGLLQGVTR